MAAVQTCTVPAPRRMNSAASCQVPMPPMPLIGSAAWGARIEGVEVDAGDGVDGVDGGECVGAGAFGGAGGHADVGDVGREFDDDGSARGFLHPFGDLLAVLGHLANGGAHASLAHAVRAAEVELEAVGARSFGALHD